MGPSDGWVTVSYRNRVDYNVPLSSTGRVENNSRVVATLPTIRLLQEGGAKRVILLSHLGRPEGRRDPAYTLRPVAEELERLLGNRVIFLEDCVGPAVEKACEEAPEGGILLLENVRFHPEEEGSSKGPDGGKIKADPERIAEFRAALSRLGDVFVQDAFGAVHRAHSSVSGIGLEVRVAGLLLQRELEYFSRILEGDSKIDLAIMGGAKVSDKIPLIKNLLRRVKSLFIGSALCCTFNHVLRGMPVGQSLFDSEAVALVPEIMEEARRLGVEIHLSTDYVISDEFSATASRIETATVAQGIPDSMRAMDIGPQSIQTVRQLIRDAKSILWNGPPGCFDLAPAFAAGTKAIVGALTEATSKRGALTIVGGGDSGAAVAKWHASDQLSHVSTGGGASLELLEGKILPGIACLSTKPE